jgi:hypothetical protein
MLAEDGKTYAQVMVGKCHWMFTKAVLPEWNENDIQVIDVTGQEVSVGDVFIDGVFSTPVPAVETKEQLAADIRTTRNKLIADTDWTQLSDKPQLLKDKWAPYRQALCDITLQEGFPENVTWPTPP